MEPKICPKCGYEPKKFAIKCPKCRTSLLPKQSASDLARHYLKIMQEGGEGSVKDRNPEKEIEAIFRAVQESKTYGEFRLELLKKLSALFFDRIGG